MFAHGNCLLALFHEKYGEETRFFAILLFKQLGVPQDWNPAATARRNPGWPRFVRLWVGTHNKSEPFLTLWKSVLGECPHGFTAPAQKAEGKILKWSRHFCGCCESIGLGEEGLKQLLCFKKKVQNYGKGIIIPSPVPELEHQQESSLQTGSSHAISEIATHRDRVLTWGTMSIPADPWDPHCLGFHSRDTCKGRCGASSALVWGRFADRVKYCGWRTLSWCDLFN